MISSAICRGIRPSLSALLKTAVTQRSHLLGASSGILGQRDLSTVGTPQKPQLLSTTQKLKMMQIVKATTESGGKIHPHATHFKIERYWAAGMLPLFPLAYFVHGPVMDYALAVALALHIHWGLFAVVQDYARPFVVGETLSKVCVNAIYIISILMFAGLIHFNYNDVGLTKAFEMVWAL